MSTDAADLLREETASSAREKQRAFGILWRLGERLEQLFEAERDQLPLWLPVGLILGIGAWFWLPDRFGWAGFLVGTVAIALGFTVFAGSMRSGRALAIFALATALGCGLIWTKAERVAAPRLAREQIVDFTGRIESVQPLAAEQTVRLLVAPSDPDHPRRLRINVDQSRAEGLVAGTTVHIRTFVLPPAPMAAPGAYDFARAAWFQQIGGSGRATNVEILSAPASQGWRARLADWRQRLAAHIRERLGGGGEGGIAASLATGDQYGISEADADAMRRSGLAHLLSVSGLHLTAVVGAVMLLTLKLLALSPTLALRYRLVVVAAAAGAIAGIALGREAMTLRLVAVGALVVVLFWPESVVGPSFQLSFAAIVAIVALHEHPRIQALLSRRDEGLLARSGRFLLGLVLTGLAVEIALSPIALFHFHRAGLYGAAANVIAIPLTTFVIMPLEALALLFDLVGLGAPFWWLAGRALSFLLWLAHFAATAPGAVALLPAMPRGAFALLAAGGLWICLWRTTWRRLGLLLVAAGAAWALSTPLPDLIVTGDGTHLVLRTNSGNLALLRPRAGDYVRNTLAELAASEPEYLELEGLPTAACSPDLCAANLDRGGRRWRILATRTPQQIRWDQMVRACAQADIVVSDRMLPRACQPRWLKADRLFLRRTGGLSIVLDQPPRVATVAGQVGRHPWAPASAR